MCRCNAFTKGDTHVADKCMLLDNYKNRRKQCELENCRRPATTDVVRRR